VVPSVQQLRDCYQLDRQVADVTGAHETLGHILALEWVCAARPAPLTERPERPVTRQLAAAENWLAVRDAAGQDPPSEVEWRRLGLGLPVWLAGNSDFSYGVWRMLGWLLGELREPPEELWQRDPDGSIPPWEQRYVTPPKPDSPAWLAARQRRRDRQRAEALAAWQRVRGRAPVLI